jgi:hypothetical protein
LVGYFVEIYLSMSKEMMFYRHEHLQLKLLVF